MKALATKGAEEREGGDHDGRRNEESREGAAAAAVVGSRSRQSQRRDDGDDCNVATTKRKVASLNTFEHACVRGLLLLLRLLLSAVARHVLRPPCALTAPCLCGCPAFASAVLP